MTGNTFQLDSGVGDGPSRPSEEILQRGDGHWEPVRSPAEVTDALDARDAQLVAQAQQWEESLKAETPEAKAARTRFVPSRGCVPDEATGRCPCCGRSPADRAVTRDERGLMVGSRPGQPRWMWDTYTGPLFAGGEALPQTLSTAPPVAPLGSENTEGKLPPGHDGDLNRDI